MERKRIYSLTEDHGPQVVAESYPNEALPQNMVYIERVSGRIVRNSKVRELPDNVIEVPKTTWYRGH